MKREIIAKESIAVAFNDEMSVAGVLELYYEIRRFATKAAELAVGDIIAEEKEEENTAPTSEEIEKELCEYKDCKECKRFFVCEGERIADHRVTGTPCELFEQK